MKHFFRTLSIFPVFRRAAVILVALAWSNLAFCGEIHDAAKAGDLEKVKSLLKTSPDLVSSKDNDGATPLHTAAYGGQLKIAETLVASGANVNATTRDGVAPLHWAAAMGSVDVCKFLLLKGADINAVDRLDRLPIVYAAHFGRKDVVDLLRSNGSYEGYMRLVSKGEHDPIQVKNGNSTVPFFLQTYNVAGNVNSGIESDLAYKVLDAKELKIGGSSLMLGIIKSANDVVLGDIAVPTGYRYGINSSGLISRLDGKRVNAVGSYLTVRFLDSAKNPMNLTAVKVEAKDESGNILQTKLKGDDRLVIDGVTTKPVIVKVYTSDKKSFTTHLYPLLRAAKDDVMTYTVYNAEL
jgi:hypothetical protein